MNTHSSVDGMIGQILGIDRDTGEVKLIDLEAEPEKDELSDEEIKARNKELDKEPSLRARHYRNDPEL